MPEEWIVDGYNVLYSLASVKPLTLLTAREKLLQNLANFAGIRNQRTVLLVLDGVGNNEEFSSYVTDAFKIVYSQHMTADSYIEKYLYDHKNQKIMSVVTKDRAVANMGRGLGARVFSPDEFRKTLKQQCSEDEEIVYKQKIKSLRFNRPFDGKL